MSPKDLITEQDHEEWLQSLGEGERREYENEEINEWKTNDLPKYETTTVVCRCPKCYEIVPLLITSMVDSHILHIEFGE